jgi:hypothetical protein
MAGMEIVVRPVVFPDIRPQPPRRLPPEEDPTKGICTIRGQGSFLVTFSIASNWSVTYGKTKEIKRRVDTTRIYQKDKDGTINKDNFVDVDVANKVWMKGGTAPKTATTETAGEPIPGTSTSYGTEKWTEYYKPVKEEDNIEIIERNKIKENK